MSQEQESVEVNNIDLENSERPQGCLTAFVIFTMLSIVACPGALWLTTIDPSLGQMLGDQELMVDLGRALGYGVIGSGIFGAIAVLLKNPRFSLWRGIALALAVSGGQALLNGIVLAVDRSLLYPGLPAWLPALITLIYSVLIIFLWRTYLAGKPMTGTVVTGAGLGILVSTVWVISGALGTPFEFLLAIFDALAMGLFSAVVISLPFAFDEEWFAAHPTWAAVLSGGVFIAMLFSLLAVRGYSLQGNMFAVTFLLFGLIAGGLLTIQGEGKVKHGWWAAAAFFIFAFLLPLAFTEGLEGDWMLDEMPIAWAPGMLGGLGIGLLLSIIVLALRGAISKSARNLFQPFVITTVALITVFSMYFRMGQPGFQPDTFLVVMADQADTEFANEIKSREERVQAVFAALTTHAEESQADLRAYLDERNVNYTAYYLVNALEVQGAARLRSEITSRPDVARIVETPRARPLPDYTEPLPMGGFTSQPEMDWGVDQMDAEIVWEDYGIRGEGILIGLADSGVDGTHPALSANYYGTAGNHDYTWLDPWDDSPAPFDAGGHGTHTLGSIIGQDGIGVAPAAEWIACRNLGRNLGNPAWYLTCMEFLFAPYPQEGNSFEGDPLKGAHLTSNSWGCPPEEGCDGLTLPVAVEHLRNAGQLFVVSAGNEGPGCSTVGSPAHADGAMTVGAINNGTGIAPFSSRGPGLLIGGGIPQPDIAAPGVDVFSSVPGGDYSTASGTSMAAPHVAGMIALMWSANPNLIGDIEVTEQIIFDTAHYVQAENLCGADDGERNNVFGYGYVDALAAVEAALELK